MKMRWFGLVVGLAVGAGAVGCDDAKKGAAEAPAAGADTAKAEATAEKTAEKTEAPKEEGAPKEEAKGEEASEEDGGEPAAEGGIDLSTPKASIATQIELLKKGDAKALATCFTARQASKITADVVEKAQAQASMMNVDELFDSAEEGEQEGKKTSKVKMKNGRTLTTLILTDGKWLADTIWFR